MARKWGGYITWIEMGGWNSEKKQCKNKGMVAQTNEFRKRKELMAIMTSGPEESKETEGLRETRLTYGRARSSTKTHIKWQGDGEESNKFCWIRSNHKQNWQ